MKDADEAVRAVMAGLRGAKAVPGLARRVQDGVGRRMAERDKGGRRSGTFVFGWRLLALGLGSVALSLVVATGVLRVDKRVVPVGTGAADRRPPPETSGASRMSVDHVARLDESVPRRRKLRPRPGDGTAETVPVPSAVSHKSSVEDQRANNTAVSFPAPPMPLTQQERLLLRIANHSGPEEVAMLDWSGHAAQDAEETAVFQEFFGRLESVEQTIQKDNQGESQ